MTILKIGDFARNVESNWLGKIEAIEERDGQRFATMTGVDELAVMIGGLSWAEALSGNDRQWHGLADLVPARESA